MSPTRGDTNKKKPLSVRGPRETHTADVPFPGEIQILDKLQVPFPALSACHWACHVWARNLLSLGGLLTCCLSLASLSLSPHGRTE